MIEAHIPMTRDEYVDRWLAPTRNMVDIFAKACMQGELIDFQLKLIEVAQKEWDRMNNSKTSRK